MHQEICYYDGKEYFVIYRYETGYVEIMKKEDYDLPPVILVHKSEIEEAPLK